jgi:hypothetical protein
MLELHLALDAVPEVGVVQSVLFADEYEIDPANLDVVLLNAKSEKVGTATLDRAYSSMFDRLGEQDLVHNIVPGMRSWVSAYERLQKETPGFIMAEVVTVVKFKVTSLQKPAKEQPAYKYTKDELDSLKASNKDYEDSL